jgi:hypothetical protein
MPTFSLHGPTQVLPHRQRRELRDGSSRTIRPTRLWSRRQGEASLPSRHRSHGSSQQNLGSAQPAAGRTELVSATKEHKSTRKVVPQPFVTVIRPLGSCDFRDLCDLLRLKHQDRLLTAKTSSGCCPCLGERPVRSADLSRCRQECRRYSQRPDLSRCRQECRRYLPAPRKAEQAGGRLATRVPRRREPELDAVLEGSHRNQAIRLSSRNQ